MDWEDVARHATVVEASLAGRGRRGVTLRGRRAADGREVALKVGEAFGSDRDARRFVSEVEAVRKLPPAPHLVPVLEAGIGPSGQPWVMSPWMAGGSLADRLAAGNPLLIEQVAGGGADAAKGLALLHGTGAVHGDLTPANLLVDAAGEVYIDTAAMAPLPWTPDGARFYTPPEVLEGGEWTAAGDLWALGACLYALLVGRAPWALLAAEGESAVILAMATGREPGPQRADCPRWLARLVEDCLALDVGARPASARAVAATFAAYAPSRADTVTPGAPAAAGAAVEGAVEAGEAVETGRPLGSSYLLLGPLGSGASGQVWRGRRRWDGAPVAVKVLRPELTSDPNAVARFLRERTTLVGLHDPHLVPVLDMVAEGSTLAIVMELVDGPDLRRVLGDEGRLAPSDALRIAAQVAGGVAAAHRAGVVHRDLKPENVLIEPVPAGEVPGPERGHGRARVTDFGIARTLSESAITKTDQLVGTMEYLAPELSMGRPLTPAVDVYALGVVLYELLAGRRPFVSDHPAAVLRMHLETAPPRIPGTPDALWALVERCLAKDPEGRPTAEECATALEALAQEFDGHPPFLAPPPAGGTPAGPPSPGPPSPGLPPAAGPSAPAPPVGLAAHALAAPDGTANRSNTAVFDSPLRGPKDDAASGEDNDTPKRRFPRWAAITAGVVAVALIGGIAGLVVALTQNNRNSPPPTEYSVDVTGNVTARGNGVVQVTWPSVSQRPGFGLYVVFEDDKITPMQPEPGATSLTLDGVAPGEHCFKAAAAFRGAIPPGLPKAATAKECVNVR